MTSNIVPIGFPVRQPRSKNDERMAAEYRGARVGYPAAPAFIRSVSFITRYSHLDLQGSCRESRYGVGK